MPLQNVTGFVGSDQIPDINKKITWDFLAENEKLEGNLVFDVKIKDAYNETNTTTKTTLVASTSTFTDPRDKQVYKWIKIGNQIWMAENLNYELDKDCFCYEYSSANCNTYGRLYTWDAAIKSCPAGWHLPSRLEWATLLKFLGDANSVGGYLKEADISHWREPNMGASDLYGFKARPGGWVTGQPYYFREIRILGCWWSSTIASENKKGQAFSHGVMLEYNSSRFFLNYVKPNYFRQSVRCIKD
jgi:uncharacterized protein (TIGR02145 family)